MKLKSKDLLTIRKTLDKDIKYLWNVILKENITDKKYKRNYDLLVIFNKIKQKSEARIKTKLFLQAINSGFTDFKEFKENTNYESIFRLSEKNELFVHLGKIETLSPKGKANKNLTEIFTTVKVRTLKKAVSFEITEINKLLEDFNNDAELEVDDSLKDYFTI